MIGRLQSYRAKVYGKPSNKVVFFFCPFGVRRWQFLMPFLPINRMLKANYQVVCYDFNIFQVTKNPYQSIQAIDQVYDDVFSRVKNYTTKNVTNISCFGISYGTLFATYCAANIEAIQSVVLNLPYGDIVDHIKTYPGMIFLPKFRTKSFMKSGGGEESLRKLLKDYTPTFYAEKLSKKRVLIYLSTKDNVLQYAISVKLKNALEKYNTNLTYVESKKYKHYASAAINNFKSDIYIKFLDIN